MSADGSSYFSPVHHGAVAVPEQAVLEQGAVPEQGAPPAGHPVVVVGAGPVGLVTALRLARLGVASVVLEAGDSVGVGSRAICVSARSLEILDACGVLADVLATALPWTGGRSYYRDREVLRFAMPATVNGLPPMVNLQQCLLEEILVAAVQDEPLVDLRWQSRLTGLHQDADAVELEVGSPLGPYRTRADWVVGADGPWSSVRDLVGMALKGETHEGRFVIADLRMASPRPAERLCWFDPPTFPGKTVLLHKQPLDIWRLDYQIEDGEDLARATDPATVQRLVAAHLAWMGESTPWQMEWLSSYRAHSLTLDDYRSGRVLLAGDAAHLVPIFGVRGLNGGLADAQNLAWKLAAVLRGAPAELLDSYTQEQRNAALQNIAAGSASARFMSPSSGPAVLLRDAALSLSVAQQQFRSLVDPRQTLPPTYPDSPLSTGDDPDDGWAGGPAPGVLLPDLPVLGSTVEQLAGGRYAVLRIGGEAALELPGRPEVPVIDLPDAAAAALDATPSAVYLVRPDRYVAARWRSTTWPRLTAALQRAGAPELLHVGA